MLTATPATLFFTQTVESIAYANLRYVSLLLDEVCSECILEQYVYVSEN
jgi:hypothetical protein